jgi:cytoskeletal protein CcmA (bactofilin family)
LTWSVYADGELSREERRSAEMHLVSCRTCRNRVVALRDEGSAITNALHERATVSKLSRPRAVPARDLAWGLPAAIAVVTAVLVIAGLLIELRLPGMLDLFNPRRLIGVYEMSINAVFMLRNRLPELFDAGAFIGAMAAFSALGCAVLHALSRRISRSTSLPLLLVLLFTLPNIARALDLRRDQDTHIGAGVTISETLVCSGDVVTIDGTIDGDLVVAAERFSMRGTVNGNVYFFGSEVEIDGTINGTVLGIGERITLSGRVDGAVGFLGDRLNITNRARIERDVALFGDGARIAGSAARDVTFAGEWLEVRAEIARNLHVLGAERVALLDGARIDGDVRASLFGDDDEIEQEPGASVGGELQVSQKSLIREHYLAHYRHPSFYLMVLVGAAAAFVFGLLIYVLDPRLFEADPPDTSGFVRSLGIGFLVFLSGPVALILVGLTVVGIPVAVLGLFILISAIYTSYILVAGLVGQAVVTPSGPGLGAFAPSLLVGVLILSVVAALPFIGPAVRILAVLFGLGCLFERARGMHALNLRRIRG